MSWRLRWADDELSDAGNFGRHSRALDASWKYWMALAAKLVPHLWPMPIRLRLQQGGVIEVRDFMTLYIYKEIFVDRCYDLPAMPLHEPVILDVGANAGLFALRMKQLYPRARISCYEPFAPNFQQLRRNLAQSGIADCALYREGVGGRARQEKLYIHKRNAGGHSIVEGQVPGHDCVQIDIVDLTSVLDRLPDGRCHLLKLDCEGAEKEILDSLETSHARRIERIVFEPTPSLYDVPSLMKRLSALGYEVSSNQGLCIAVQKGLAPHSGKNAKMFSEG